METGWIQVFVLVITECVAPAGKTVCQEHELRYEFFERSDCDVVLEQLLEFKDNAENIIVNRDQSSCLPTAKKQRVFRSSEDVKESLSDSEGWGRIPAVSGVPDFTQEEHAERLGNVPNCEEVANVAPCKMGDIIIEGASEKKSEVWRRTN